MSGKRQLKPKPVNTSNASTEWQTATGNDSEPNSARSTRSKDDRDEDAEESKPGATDQVIHHATLRLSNAAIRCVHLPAEFDAPELMISRLRAIDRGRHRFRKRVQLQPKARPERHAPIVSANVTEADAFGT